MRVSAKGGRELPPRPLIPASAAGAAGAVGAAALLLQAGWERYGEQGTASLAGASALAAPLLGAAFAVLGLALRRHGSVWSRQPALWLAWAGAGVLAGGAASALWLAHWDACAAALEGRTLSACVLVTTSDASLSDYGAYSTAKVYDEDGTYLATVRLGTEEALDVGTALVAVGTFEALDEGDWARSRFFKGEAAVADAVTVLSQGEAEGFAPLRRARAAALSAIDPFAGEARALLAGIVCGYTTALSQTQASDDFATCGLSHLVAVSGSHLALISLLLAGVLRRVTARPALRAGALVAVMGLYAVFTGGAPSAVRSVCMVAAGMLSGLGGRRAHPLSGLSLTVLLLAVLDPGVVYDLGFQLSAMSVLFIDLFCPYLTHLLGRLHVPDALAEPLSLTLCAQWATLPLTVPVFGAVSLMAPLANLVAGPLMSALLVAGMVTVPLAAALPALQAVLWPALGLANASIFAARALASVPYASLAADASFSDLLFLYAIAAAVYLLWRDWSARALLGALGAVALLCGGTVVRWAWFAPASITVLDVGQADCILVRDGADVLLVDAGVDEEALLALARNHVYSIDAVVITHWDSDHYGGLDEILASLPVGAVIVAEGAADEVPDALSGLVEDLLCELSYGDVLEVGGFTARMVWPQGEVEGDENEDSLVLAVEYEGAAGSLSALLAGDTESDQLSAYAAEVGDIDLLKVGHHGSKVSVDAASLAVLDPEVAVASAGEDNAYGHPTEECIALVEASGAVFLCTIECGDVAVYPGDDGVRVVTQNDS